MIRTMKEQLLPSIFLLLLQIYYYSFIFCKQRIKKGLLDNISNICKCSFCILRGKKFEKRHIELFTDLNSPVSEDQLEIIVANLKKTGISLQFL